AFSRTALACGACMPEALRNEAGLDSGDQECFEPVEHSEGSGVPDLFDPSAARHKEVRDVPAGVADGIVERSADRTVGCLDVGAAIDQRSGYVDVVVARGVVKRRLGPWARCRRSATRGPRVRVGASINKCVDNLGTVRVVAGPACNKVQSRTRAALDRTEARR